MSQVPAPQMSSNDNPGTPREIAQYFARMPSAQVLMAMVAVSLSARTLVGDFGVSDVLVALGVLVAWPFVEWLVHVYWLHLKPIEVPSLELGPIKTKSFNIDSRVAKKHRRHHRDPWRLDDVMIPLHTYALSIPGNLLFWFGLFELPQALTGLAMVSLLGLHYELVHLVAHCRYRPRNWYYARLWRNHRLHHCKNENHWLGVTMLLGDRVLKTGGHPSKVETSSTCRTLGQEETLGV